MMSDAVVKKRHHASSDLAYGFTCIETILSGSYDEMITETM